MRALLKHLPSYKSMPEALRDAEIAGSCTRISRVSNQNMRQLLLFLRHTPDSPEDGALHKVIRVRAEAVNDVVVVPAV
jgi:hypothetical protein